MGRLGGLRVLVMPNTRPDGDGDGSHVLMIDAAPSYDANRSQARAPAQNGGKRSRIEADDTPLIDDPIPL
jgi:hypothetical protein